MFLCYKHTDSLMSLFCTFLVVDNLPLCINKTIIYSARHWKCNTKKDGIWKIRQRQQRSINDLYFKMIVRIQSKNGVASVGCRTTADSNARINRSRYRDNNKTNRLLRESSLFPFNQLLQFVFWTRQGQSLQISSNLIPHMFDWWQFSRVRWSGKHLYTLQSILADVSTLWLGVILLKNCISQPL